MDSKRFGNESVNRLDLSPCRRTLSVMLHLLVETLVFKLLCIVVKSTAVFNMYAYLYNAIWMLLHKMIEVVCMVNECQLKHLPLQFVH